MAFRRAEGALQKVYHQGKFCLAFLFVFYFHGSQAQNQWVLQSDFLLDDNANSVAIDAAGQYFYVVGSISTVTSGLPIITNMKRNNGVNNMGNFTAYGSKDAYLSKYTISGNLVWTINFGGSGFDEANKVCVGSDGNIYITGYYFEALNMPSVDGSPTVVQADTDSNTNCNAFICSYAPNGDARWVKSNGGDGNDYGHSICAVNGGIAMIGQYSKVGNTTVQSQAANGFGGSDMFLAKYGFTGSSLWFISGGSPFDDNYSTVDFTALKWDIASYGNKIYSVSTFEKAAYKTYDITNSLALSFNVTGTDNELDYILHCVQDNGSIQWVQKMEQGSGEARGCAIAASASGVYLSLSAFNSIVWPGGSTQSVGSSQYDMVIGKLNPSTASMVWNKKFDGPQSGTPYNIPLDMSLDASDNIYLTGRYRTGMSVDAAIFSNTASNIDASFIAKFSSIGNFVYGETHSFASNTEGLGLDYNPTLGNAIYVGATKAELISNLTTFNYSEDAFIESTMLDPCTNLNAGVITLSEDTLCSGAPFTAIVIGSSGVITWEYSYDQITWNTGSAGTTHTDIANSSVYYRTTASKAGCTSITSTPVFLKVIPPQTANAGPDINTCSCTTNMQAVGPNPDASGVWQIVSGSATFADSSVYNTSVTGLFHGENVFRWMLNNSVCGTTVDVVNVTVSFEPPIIQCPVLPTYTIQNGCDVKVAYEVTAEENCHFCAPSSLPNFSHIGDLSGHRYFLSNNSCSWPTADSLAKTLGGHLVTISSATENTFLQTTGPCWIGMNDVVTEGNFVWSNGEPVTYTNWANSQPDNVNGADYGTNNYLGTDKWDDQGVVLPFGHQYILEFDCINSSIAPTLISGLPSESNFPLGTSYSTYEVVDGNSQTSSCTVLINVVDSIKPTITCPPDITVNVDAGSCFATVTTVTLGIASATDNCGIGSVTKNYSLPTFPIGTTTVTWKATDNSGNSTTCDQTVTVVDNINPTITCPPDVTVHVDAGSCNAVLVPAMIGSPTVSDNCGNPTITNNHPSQVYPKGTTTILWTATDASGRTSTCNQQITVVDNINPTIICPPAVNVNVNAGSCTATVSAATLGTPTVSDNCVGTTVTNNHPSTTYPIGTTTVVWTVTDASGRSATCNQLVTVTDNIDPTITCPPAVNVNVNAASCTATVSAATLGTPTISDNCVGATVTNNHPSTSYSLGTTTVVWTVTDASGRTATCNQLVTVTDNIDPTITCPPTVNVNVNAGSCTATVSAATLGTPTVSDNCIGTTATNNHPSTTYPIGTTTVVWTVTDGSGRTATCNQLVIVTDNIDPTIVCPPAVNVFVDANACVATVSAAALGTPTVSDNCVGTTVTNNHPSTTYPVGVTNVIWTVTDASGRTATCTQTVTVTDNILPSINCNGEVEVNASPLFCGAIVTNIGTPTTSDNCSVQSVTNNHPSTSYPVGTTNVIWTVTDVNGNINTCITQVKVEDKTNPQITCPAAINVNVSTGSCNATIANLGTPTTFDNCGVATVTNNHPSAIYPIGTTTVVWTVTDVSGRTATCNQLVTVTDNIDPIITCPPALNVNVDANSCVATISAATLGTPTVSDNCVGTTVTNNHPSTTYSIGTTTVVWTVTDASGRTATCNQLVTVTDNINPTITCPPAVNVNVNAGSCTATVSAATLGTPAISDNCVGTTVTNNHPSTTYSIGTTTVVWTVTDASGRTATCNQLVTVTDNIDPTITCPPAVNVNALVGSCTATVNAATLGTPTVSDNCVGTTVTNNHPSTTYSIGTTTVVWTVTDASGRTATCNQLVTVTDNIDPTITCPPAVNVNVDANSCVATISAATLGTPTVSDNCSGTTVTNNHPSTSYSVGTTTVVWTVTDASGRTATCNQLVTVTDNINPTITCPPAVNVNVNAGSCTATVSAATLGTPTVSDNCVGTTVTNNHPSTTYSIGTTTVVWTVTDASGRTTTCNQLVTVTDNIDPTITCPPAVNVNALVGSCTATVNAATLGTPTVSDNCVGTTVTNNHPSTTYSIGTTTVVWTVTDASGRTATCNQLVTVTDNIDPTITCPPAVNVNVDANSCVATISAATLGTPTVSDNCAGTTVTNNHPSTSYSVGTTTVVWTVTDASGRTATCNQLVTVTDNINPTITCPPAVNVNVNANSCVATVSAATLGTPTVSDNCVGTTITNNHPSTTYSIGTTTVVWTVTDASGRTATCNQLVTVTDNILPTITCPNNIVQDADAFTCHATINNIGSPSAIDNCGISSITNNHSSSIFDVGITNVVWTILDVNGNSIQCTQIVEILGDTSLQVLNCPTDTTVDYNSPCGYILPDYISTFAIEAINACGEHLVLEQSPVAGTIINTDSTVEIHDQSTGEVYCTFTVNTDDVIAPSIICPENITASASAECQTWLDIPYPEVSDNCEVPSYSHDHTFASSNTDASAYYPAGVTYVTWIVTDNNGLENSCVQTIEINDLSAPSINCPPNIYSVTSVNSCDAFVAVNQPTVSDNCGIASITNSINSSDDASGVFPIGMTNITWVVIDNEGLVNQCTHFIEINDGIIPIIVCPSDTTIYSTTASCLGEIIPDAQNIATGNDNCPNFTISNNHPLTTYPLGSTTVVWTIQDIAGNTNQCQQNVTVLDTIQPTIICETLSEHFIDYSQLNSFLSIEIPAVSDNCGSPTLTNDFNNSSDASSIYNLGSTFVTWTTTDQSGNSATCLTEVSVIQTTVPFLQCADTIFAYTGTGVCEADIEIPTATTNLIGLTNDFTNTADASGIYPIGQTNIEWTASEFDGTIHSCITHVLIVDTILPIIECISEMTIYSDPGEAFSTSSVPLPNAMDNCTGYTLINDITGTNQLPGSFIIGEQAILWTITDASGNTNSCNTLLHVLDESGPVVLCQDTIIAYTDSLSCQSSVFIPSPEISEENVTFTLDYPTDSNGNGVFNTGMTDVQWTITDINGAQSHCSTIVRVYDIVAPIIECVDSIHVSTQLDSCSRFVEVPIPTYYENCEVASIINTYTNATSASTNYQIGYTMLYWFVADNSGNQSNYCATVIHVIDSMPPIIICPADTTIMLGMDEEFIIPEYTSQLVISQDCSNEVNLWQSIPNGTHITSNTTVDISATDASLNSSYCHVNINIVDIILPTILNCPDTLVLPVNSNCEIEIPDFTSSVLPTEVSVTGSYVVHQHPEAGATGSFTEIEFWIEDSYGNMSDTCHTPIITTDSLPPVFISADEAILYLDENCQAIIPDFNNWIHFEDNCGTILPNTQTPSIGVIVNGLDPISATYSVMDSYGNVINEEYEFTISILDTIAPIVTAPSFITTYLDANCDYIMPDVTEYLTIEDCSPLTLSQSIAPGSLNNGAQTTSVQIDILDENANIIVSYQIDVIAQDTIAPTINQIANQTIDQEPGMCYAQFDASTLISATDGCDSNFEIVVMGSSNNQYEIGSHVIQYFAQDASGNISDTLEFQLYVQDTEAPTFITVNDTIVCDPSFHQDIMVMDCGMMLIAEDLNSTLQEGTNTLHYTYSDGTYTVDYEYQVTLISAPTFTWTTLPENLCAESESMEIIVTSDSPYELSLDGTLMSNGIVDPSLLTVGSHEISMTVGPVGCITEVSQTITINNKPTLEIEIENVSVCGLKTKVSAITTGDNITWTAGENSIIENVFENIADISAETYGSGWIYATSASNGCFTTDSLLIFFNEMPGIPDAGDNQTLYLTENTELNGSYTGAGTIHWEVVTGSGIIEMDTLLQTTITGLNLGSNAILLVATNENCIARDTVEINVNGLFIPNGFSPNGDGVNDTFHVRGLEQVQTSELSVFNRWGQMVYGNKNYRNVWNGVNNSGESLTDDTYFYELIIDNEKHQGFVIIKR